MVDNPAKTGYIGNSNAIADEQPVWRFGQMSVHGSIEAIGFIGVAIDAVLNLFGCVSCGYLISVQHIKGSRSITAYF